VSREWGVGEDSSESWNQRERVRQSISVAPAWIGVDTIAEAGHQGAEDISSTYKSIELAVTLKSLPSIFRPIGIIIGDCRIDTKGRKVFNPIVFPRHMVLRIPDVDS